MPIRVQNDLPVKEILEQENIFVMDEHRATHQDIRPIKIGLLNLMPLKILFFFTSSPSLFRFHTKRVGCNIVVLVNDKIVNAVIAFDRKSNRTAVRYRCHHTVRRCKINTHNQIVQRSIIRQAVRWKL